MILMDLDPAFYALGAEEQGRVLGRGLEDAREKVERRLVAVRAGAAA